MKMPEVDLEAFSYRMLEAREKSGLSYQELAERAECSMETLRGYEHCKKPPELKTITRVAEALGMKVEELVPEYKGLKTSMERLRTEDWSNYTVGEIAKEIGVCEKTIRSELAMIKRKYGVTVNFRTASACDYIPGRSRWVKRGQCETCGYRCNLSGRAACQYILIAGKQRPTPIERGIWPAYERSKKPFDCEGESCERQLVS